MPAASAPRRRLASWPDAVIAFVDRLPGAPWLTYALFTAVATSAFLAQRAAENIELNTVTLAYTVFTVLPLAAMHYTNRAAGRALDEFRPALGDLEQRYDELRRRLTTMPVWSALVAAAVGVGVLVVGQLTARGLWGIRPEYSTATNVTTGALQVILNAGFAAFVFHTIAQVHTIARIHRDATNIQLWNTAPHNAFSGFTLMLAFVIIVPFSTVQILSAARAQLTPVEVFVFAVAIVLAIALFILPLVGMRSRLTRGRTRELDECTRVFAETADRLRRAVVADDLAAVPLLKDSLSGIALEQDRLRKVSTWPWTADTFRGFVTTLGIPIALWFLTTLLGRVFF